MKKTLDILYDRYNHREYANPDPLVFLYKYENVRDREIVGLIASSLAYGRVAQILRSVSSVLDAMRSSPSAFLKQSSRETFKQAFCSFKHRFTTGEELAAMLFGAKKVIERYGSLNGCFIASSEDQDRTTIPALTSFVKEIRDAAGLRRNSLLPSPADGSACKRLHLFLRWMVRRDAVDPGGWDGVPSSKLIIPLDTHMFRIAKSLGFTERRQANGKTAVEVTSAFREIAPDDPVRYDFALTRLGIRNDADIGPFISECAGDNLTAGPVSAVNPACSPSQNKFSI
jgi:uncharacterized protein (TIGR02757 family)